MWAVFLCLQGEREEKEAAFRQHDRSCKGYVPLANEVIQIFKYISDVAPGPFIVPELVDRLAAMLDYNLKQLVGPECQNLKVERPERYKFEPKRLLDDITQIYINLSKAVCSMWRA